MFSLTNEPWLKYNMAAVADKGLRPHEWTSAKLHCQVMYLESHRCALRRAVQRCAALGCAVLCPATPCCPPEGAGGVVKGWGAEGWARGAASCGAPCSMGSGCRAPNCVRLLAPGCACCACRERYELALIKSDTEGGAGGSSGGGGGEGGSGGEPAAERYRFSRCKRLLPAASMRRLGVALPAGEVEVLHSDLGWEEIQVGAALPAALRWAGAPLCGCSLRSLRRSLVRLRLAWPCLPGEPPLLGPPACQVCHADPRLLPAPCCRSGGRMACA